MKKIILFASGSGTNAETIIRHFATRETAKVTGVYTNNPNAGVIKKANDLYVPAVVFNRVEFESSEFLDNIKQQQPDLIVLAGFLWKIPAHFIAAFPHKILNIHPALLPKYGGKGMYGMHVHQSVLDQKETETGITIHLVNEHYDQGAFVFQQKVSIAACKTAEEIAQKVHELEHTHFPTVIETQLLSQQAN
ncbi:MAG: phosphoribosylglycinamide formyltransferase [Flavobacterium sp.]|nr:phosphoribosylglycinamide formyltransferase [Flavobacterium sp.]